MKRVVTALFLVPIAVYSTLFAPWFLFVAVVVIASLQCFREFAEITGSFAPLGYVAGLLVLLVPQHVLAPLFILTALGAMCLPLAAPDLERSVMRSASLLLGIVYIFGSWRTAILLHDADARPGAFGAAAGHHWMMFALLVNWIGDTGAYYVGRRYGRHKLAPIVSPGKSWEGAWASAVTGGVFGLVYLRLTIPSVPIWEAALLAVAANAAGQIGDLAESAIKRGAGVKDSGSLLPGHGGVLDRVDSTMFAIPVTYVLLTLLNP